MKKLYTFFGLIFLAASLSNVTAQEVIIGGDMEEESAEHWTIVDLAAGNGHLETFGYTSDTPSDGEDGCLSMEGSGNWSNAAVCQELSIFKGVDYKLSMLVKTSADLEIDNNWVEVVLVPSMPAVDADITAHPIRFSLNSWDCPENLSVDGNFADWNCGAKSELLDDIFYEGTGDTTVVLVIKVGGNNNYNILFDNVSFMEVEVAVEENEIDGKFNQVYPNPATDQITISNIDTDEIQIFDIIGKEVFSTTNIAYEMTVDISEFKAGTYFVRTGKTTTLFIKK